MQSHHVLGMRVDYAPKSQFYKEIISRALAGQAGYCCVPNVHQCILSYENPDHRRIVNSADWVLSDSTILQRTRSWLYGVPLQTPVRGAEIMIDLCAQAAGRGVKVGFFGASPKSIEGLKLRLSQGYPSLNIAFAASPPFRALGAEENDQFLSDMTAAGVQLLFVGMGCPKQETWMALNRDKFSGAMIGVGAAFDFNAGVVKAAPATIHRLGFDWLWRLLAEPRRLFKRYMTTSPKFILLAIRQKMAA